MTSLPKLSFVLLAHNREKYIRGAIESAFAQDYEGELEFIFSDDCSTDGTFAIMQECVAAYKGNRRVVLTQTPQNLHLAGHTNHALTFVTSDWLIRADDDDYSTIDRCTVIGKAIAQHPDCRYVIHGLKFFTDEQDEDIIKLSQQCSACEQTHYKIRDPRQGFKVVRGHDFGRYSYKAWHMDVYRIFGSLNLDAYYVDDLCSYYRANILGYGVSIENATAYLMRNGSNNMSRGGDDNQHGYKAIMRLERFNDKYYNLTLPSLTYDLKQIELYLAKQATNLQAELANYISELNAEISKRQVTAQYWRKGTLFRLRYRKDMRYKGIFTLIRCLPMPLFAIIQVSYRKFK